MHTSVYASDRQPATYVWLRNSDDFDCLPAPLRQRLGPLRPVLELELTPDRTLPNADADAIIKRLTQQGWYLQLPPGTPPAHADTAASDSAT